MGKIKGIKKPSVVLVGQNGNAFAIMGRVSKALRKAGADKDYIKQYTDEAMSDDYDNLLRVTMKYVNIIE